MKKLMLTICLVLGLIIAPVVMADTVTVSRYTGYYETDGGWNGGEFTAIIGDTSNPPDLEWVLANYAASTNGVNGTNSFQSFCLETTEYTGSNLNFEITQNAIMGGNPPDGDPISVGTAWLYYQFAKGVLTGYQYTPGEGREDDAKELQNAIWMLEGAITWDGSNDFIELLFADTGYNDETLAKANNNWTYPVAALNLYKDGKLYQDQLVLVPEPGILILLGIAMSAVGLAARRFKI